MSPYVAYSREGVSLVGLSKLSDVPKLTAPPAGFEPAPPPPEGGALSPELRGLVRRCGDAIASPGAGRAYRTPDSVLGVADAPDDLGGPTTILVVDDTASIRFLIRTNLELEGYAVLEAVDGEDCLEQVAESPPDLITIDAVMPRRDGLSTVSALRGDARSRLIPIVMVSTQSQNADVRRGFEAGVDAYVVKPFDPDELVATVRGLLPSR